MMIPDENNFVDWVYSLIVDYPDQDVPTYEGNWEEFGNLLCSTGIFMKKNIPCTVGYFDPVQWAKDVFKVMN